MKYIKQYTKEGKFIKKWDSIKTAGETLNINICCIGRCCKGEIKTSGGYVWKYVKTKSKPKLGVFEPIPDFPTYYASEDGRIFRDSPRFGWRELNQQSNKRTGYRFVQPYIGTKRTIQYVHRLVLSAFKGKCPKNYECDHIDRNIHNNHISNLRWISKHDNLQRRQKNFNRKSTKYTSKWEKTKPEILKLRNQKVSIIDISKKLNCPLYLVYHTR